MFFSDKIGAEKILSIYWFVILIITVVGIYGMVALYYDHPYDIRELEANLLANKIADCISYQGELNESLFNGTTGKLSDEFNKDFLNICGINFNTEKEHKWGEDIQYYSEINFYDLDKNSLGSIIKGDVRWKEYCELKGEKEFKLFSKCVNTRFFSLYKDKPILVNIIIGVRKTEKNVKA